MIIAPAEGETAGAIASVAASAGWRVVPVALPPRRGETLAEDHARTDRLVWNPASFVSAGTLALTAAKTLGRVDTVVILSSPVDADRSLFGGSPGSIGAALEASVHGPAFLTREMLRLFDGQRSGKLLLVSVEPLPEGEGGRDAFASLVSGAFRGLGEGIFERGKAAPWTAFGIVEKSGKPTTVAEFALKLLDDPKASKSGRWVPFNGKAGLFGMF